MPQDRYFNYKKSQIETFLRLEFKKKFRSAGKISVRKRKKFIDIMTKKVSKQFGKDILFLINFSKQGFLCFRIADSFGIYRQREIETVPLYSSGFLYLSLCESFCRKNEKP